MEGTMNLFASKNIFTNRLKCSKNYYNYIDRTNNKQKVLITNYKQRWNNERLTQCSCIHRQNWTTIELLLRVWTRDLVQCYYF